MLISDPIVQFYQQHLPEGVMKDTTLTAPCPFCGTQADKPQGKIVVYLNSSSFFRGFFQCRNSCVPGGFAHWFARLAGIDLESVPGYAGENQLLEKNYDYPKKNINTQIDQFQAKLASDPPPFFSTTGITDQVLRLLSVGYNGRYLVYPYRQLDGSVYSARCVHPDNSEDFFWYGDTAFAAGPTGLFNVEDILRCENGALFLCEGEENLVAIKQLGFPGVAVAGKQDLEDIDAALFSSVRTLFIVMNHNMESAAVARMLATRIGYKVRVLQWERSCRKNYSLAAFAADAGPDFGTAFGKMILSSRPFSPFATPEREYGQFCTRMAGESGMAYDAMFSGFAQIDARLHGIHGLNIIGGGPKVGKSCFVIQIATQMAGREIPVLYYDFENGRYKIYQRTLSRLSRIETAKFGRAELSSEQEDQYAKSRKKLEKMLRYFRVINDRQVSPEIMRRHIDFIRHETQREYVVVVIDSLHKLPFKNFNERRTGIDAWLREMESIRDQLQTSFLVISELVRGEDGSYEGEPHMGVFKGSGDIEYSADNAMVLFPEWNHLETAMSERVNKLWLVGSREHSPGLIGKYTLEYPYWSFREEDS